ncbi:hypothetical protein My1_088 [Pectobacterium phage My1]|uniref:Uncharacterized protein n=1 Tax=Pectobacterium phage My1 TaxID=1204539 RepID=J9QNX3_9CAUD|nr:hypothetical protein My1_088 [Pectobacterium phage My1]AFQ22247.1 hypothetical protein My1_088 [Pectobacterium phage My1]
MGWFTPLMPSLDVRKIEPMFKHLVRLYTKEVADDIVNEAIERAILDRINPRNSKIPEAPIPPAGRIIRGG